MRVRANVVEAQLREWTVVTSIQSARQTDGSSCGSFVVMVCSQPTIWSDSASMNCVTVYTTPTYVYTRVSSRSG